ncbi:MAG: hypothetical protein EBZ40_10035, partial [Gammaproteobacteria bacterium]|nr:hypothetical protein [Gammaproteobacteria bacterium]
MSIWAALGLGFAGSLFGIALARLFEHLRRPRKDFSSDITPVDLARGGARGDELMERCGLEPEEAA